MFLVLVVSEVKEELGSVFAHVIASRALKGLKENVKVLPCHVVVVKKVEHGSGNRPPI